MGIQYNRASPEAEPRDMVAASELSLHALARHVREMRANLGLPCPTVVLNLADSDLWKHVM